MTKKEWIDIEGQWTRWQANNDPAGFVHVDADDLKSRIINDLTYVSAMDVKEYTLYQKWCEVKEKFPVTETFDLTQMTMVPHLVSDEQNKLIKDTKASIWMPNCLDDYFNLQPVMEYTDDSTMDIERGIDGKNVERETKRTKDLPEKWNVVRTFTSTMKNNSNIGRNLNFLVKDGPTGKLLGCICISSDFLDLTPRDNWIGWSRERKTQGRGINFTAIGSTIVPLQPLGYNAMGGKLLALLCLSDEVQRAWVKEYDDILVGLTTTSLYGNTKANGMSQYDGLDHWNKMGFTNGSVSYDTSKETRYMMIDWIKENYTRKYFEWYSATNPAGQPYKRDHKNRSQTFAYTKLGIPKKLIRSEHQRGIYFAPLYDNTREFLQGQDVELKKSFDTSTKALTDIWKTKYAKGRLKMLEKKGRLSTETLFYDSIIYDSWEETKARYLEQVGR